MVDCPPQLLIIDASRLKIEYYYRDKLRGSKFFYTWISRFQQPLTFWD